MAFDKDEKKCNNKTIFHIDKMKELIEEKNIHVGIITVPKEAVQDVCDKMIESGIKGIWNFAPTHLKVPQGISVKNEDLSTSLAVLIRQMNITK